MKTSLHTLLPALAALLIPLCSFADTEVVDGIEWTFTVSNGEVSLGGGFNSPAVPTSTTGSLTIPDTLGHCPVTSIGEYAFFFCNDLTSITIPDCVTNIESSAFCSVGGSPTITLPHFIDRISDHAFAWSGLASISIPDGVTSIDDNAFRGCRKLESILLPNSVTNIGAEAFCQCVLLSAITLPTDLQSIASCAFQYCESLQTITIPNSVTSIGANAFSGTALTEIYLPVSFCEDTDSLGIPAGCTINYTPQEASLDTITAFGAATPEAGRTTWSWGDTIQASVSEAAPVDGVRLHCTGWTGTGSVPESGTETNVTFSIRMDSELTWNWETQALISVSVSGGASLFGSQWVSLGEISIAEVVPDTHLYSISLSGDTDGVTLSGTTLTIPANGPRNITVTVSEVKLLFDVATDHGTVTPMAGRTEWSWGDMVAANVEADEPADGVRYVCTGWTGTGSVPASGTGTNLTFAITEDSSLAWNWRQENRIGVSVAGCGSCDFGTQWVADGETVTTTIIPSPHLYEISLSGDTNGVTLADTTLTIPSDGPRDIAVTVSEIKLSLDVTTDHGTATPAAGRTEWSWNDEVAASVATPAPVDGVRYVCTGWTGTGSAPASGTATNVTFTITEDSSLSWNWCKENQIAVSVAGCGSCDFGTQWIADGETVTTTIIPSPHLYEISLSGDTNGVTLADTTLTIPSDGPRDIAVTVSEIKLSLDVTTDHGTATPAAGRTEWSWNDEVAASVATSAPVDGVRYVCTGWTGTGSAPASGTGTNLTFTITEDSSLSWNWCKENQIAVVVSGDGSCSFGTQWIADGTTVVAEIVPDGQLYTIALAGDTNGVTFAETTLIIPSDGPRDIAVTVTDTKVAFDVATEHGTTIPETGRTECSWGSVVTAAVYEPEPENGIRYVCTGWTGTGSVPASGTGTNLTFTITEDSSLVWNWRKENRIAVAVTGAGSCAFGTQWVEDGAMVTMDLTPTESSVAVALSGDTGGVLLNGMTLTVPANQPRDIAVEMTGITWTYTVSNGEASLGYYLSDDYHFSQINAVPESTKGAIVIPSFINGYPVTSIGISAFSGCSGLTSITIPDSVTSIGSDAFWSCSGLTSITIPNSVTSIGSNAFADCSDTIFDTTSFPGIKFVDGWVVGCAESLSGDLDLSWTRGVAGGAFSWCSRLTSIAIPTNAVSIGPSTFWYCSGLRSFTIPNSVTSIGGDSFGGCSGLTSLTIPNSVTCIGDYAFSKCSGLTSITIPDSVTAIGNRAFEDCANLTMIVPGHLSWLERHYDLKEDKGPLAGAVNVSIAISSSSTFIVGGAFRNCRGLKSIVIPGNVTEIGGEAFNCSDLTSVTIGDGVASIGDNAFSYCRGLTSITIPNSVTNIGAHAFSASGLTSIALSANLTSISSLTFDSCSELTSITIPDSVTSIGEQAFRECKKLKMVTVGQGVTNIGSLAFQDCSGLTNAVIGNSVTTIGWEAFIGCSGLTSITIPDSVTSIGGGAFGNCSGLMNAVIGNGVTNIGYWAFGNCSGLTSITIPDGVTSIGDDAFGRCSGLVSITIPDSVTSIGDDAFGGCSGLTSIAIPNSVTSIGSSVFSGCSALETLYLPRMFEAVVGSFDIRSECEIVFYDSVLVVESDYGLPDPVGKSYWSNGSAVWTSVLEPEPIESTRLACAGWTGTGSVPASGTGTNVAFTITEDSTLTWNWETQALVSVSVSGGSSLFGSQWVALVGTAMAEIVPGFHLYEIAIAGDTNGVSVAGTTLSIPVQGPRNIEVTVSEVLVELDVATAHGTPAPKEKTTRWSWNDTIVAGIGTPLPTNGWKYLCNGWTGTGSVPASGEGTNVTFTITEDSTLTWSWTTNVWAECIVTGDATSDGLAAWLEKDGAGATVSFAPNGEPFSVALTGDTDGVVLDTDACTVSIPADRPRSVGVSVCFHRIDNAVETGAAAAWTSGADADGGWHVAADPTAADGYSLRSDEIAASQTAAVQVSLPLAGTLSFDWRVSSAVRRHFACFYVDGARQDRISGETDWATVALDLGDGPHTIRWTYEKSSAAASGDDAAFLDNMRWDPLTLPEALDETNVVWTTEGGADWTPQVSVSADGRSAARSGALVGEETSRLVATVDGPGTLAWKWKTDVEDLAGVDVYLDGTMLDEPYLMDEPDWTDASLAIEGDGPHRVEFRFWNGGTEATISDCAYIDGVAWTPAGAASVVVEGVEIPIAWLDEAAASIVAASGGDYAAAAEAPAANGVNEVWECYVAGLDPTNAASRLLATIDMVDGEPAIRWTPDLNEGGTRHERDYVVEGKTNLVDRSWGPTNEATRFFRVRVQMP